MKVRFLLDENLPPRLKVALLRLNPTVDIVRVGDPDAPPLGTPVGKLAQDLLLVWEASEAEEWIDQLGWIPF